jgi:hypothetical protein
VEVEDKVDGFDARNGRRGKGEEIPKRRSSSYLARSFVSCMHQGKSIQATPISDVNSS